MLHVRATVRLLWQPQNKARIRSWSSALIVGVRKVYFSLSSPAETITCQDMNSPGIQLESQSSGSSDRSSRRSWDSPRFGLQHASMGLTGKKPDKAHEFIQIVALYHPLQCLNLMQLIKDHTEYKFSCMRVNSLTRTWMLSDCFKLEVERKEKRACANQQ